MQLDFMQMILLVWLESLISRLHLGREYILLDKDCSPVNRLIYPAPTPLTKGVGILPAIDGNLLLGPTAVDVDEKEDCSTSTEGMNRILKECLDICPYIDTSKIIAAVAGLRAVADTNDLVIGPTAIASFFNAAGILSPGLSSAPSIAREITVTVAHHLKVESNLRFEPENEKRFVLQNYFGKRKRSSSGKTNGTVTSSAAVNR